MLALVLEMLLQHYASGVIEMTEKGCLYMAAMIVRENPDNRDAALEWINRIEDDFCRGVAMAYWWQAVNGKSLNQEFDNNVDTFNWLYPPTDFSLDLETVFDEEVD